MATTTPVRAMSTRTTLGAVLLVSILAGGNFTAIKFAVDHTTPLFLTAMRAIIGGAILFVVARVRGEQVPRSAKEFGNIFVVAVTVTTASSGLLVFGVSRVPAGVASLIASTMPLFTAVLAFALLATRTPRAAAFGLALGFGGTATLASGSISGDTSVIGLIAMLGAAFTWALGTVYMKWADFTRISPIMLVSIQLPMSAAILVPLAFLFEDLGQTEWNMGLFVPLAYAAIVASAGNFTLLATITLYASPTQAASTAYLMPLFGVLFAWLIADETLGWAELGGGVLIVIGVYFVVTATARARARAAVPTPVPT